MNGYNRRRKYRRSAYRRRHIGTVLITVAISVVSFLIILLIVGNILHKKSIARHTADASEDTPPVSDAVTADEKRQSLLLNGRLCLLRADGTTVFEDRIELLLKDGHTQLSVPMNDRASGSLLYGSNIGSSIGVGSSSDGDLDGAIKAAKDREMTVSGIYYLNALSIEDPLVRSAELSRAAAIISEILNKGADEVSVVAPGMSAERIDEIIEFVSDIHSLTESGAVGITVSEDILTSDDASALISRLDEGVDFLCVDLSLYGEAEPSEYIDGKINSDYLIYLHMYKMRLLLPYSDNADAQNAIIGVATDNGMNNWQIIK